MSARMRTAKKTGLVEYVGNVILTCHSAMHTKRLCITHLPLPVLFNVEKCFERSKRQWSMLREFMMSIVKAEVLQILAVVTIHCYYLIKFINGFLFLIQKHKKTY